VAVRRAAPYRRRLIFGVGGFLFEPGERVAQPLDLVRFVEEAARAEALGGLAVAVERMVTRMASTASLAPLAWPTACMPGIAASMAARRSRSSDESSTRKIFTGYS
jgi:hypothetical protein